MFHTSYNRDRVKKSPTSLGPFSRPPQHLSSRLNISEVKRTFRLLWAKLTLSPAC